MAEKFGFVTGASSGLGFSLAKELVQRGYGLAICSAGHRLEVAAQELQATGVQIISIQGDLATRDGVRKRWNRLVALSRKLDVAS